MNSIIRTLRYLGGPRLLVVAGISGCTSGSDWQTEELAAAGNEVPSHFTQPDQQAGQSPEKLALIVAIGEQGEASQGGRAYRRLEGPPNDVDLVSAALQHHGFLPENMATLQDEQATRSGILEGLQGLIDRAGPGDIAVFHFSGHGHQITDDESDEEIDGYDEVLVPYGAPDYSASPDDVQAAYSGDHHIRDDTLGVLLDQLQAKVGAEGNVAVFLDACFSGTGTRGAGELAARGGERPIGQPAGDGTVTKDLRGGGLAEMPGTRGPSARGGGEDVNYIVVSAASHQQKAWETYHTDGRTVVGPLSHALAVALPKMRPGNSYRDLHGLIVEVIRGKQLPQSPQIEGPADTEVFGNLVTDPEAWIRITSDEGEGRVILDGGQLRGLGPDSEVEIRASVGSDDPNAVLTTGVVIESSPLSSVLQLDSLPSGGRDLTTGRAFVTRESFGDLTTKIMIDEGVDAAIAGEIRDSLDARWIVSVVGDESGAADGIISQESDGRMQLTRPYDRVPVGEPLDVSDSRGVGRLATFVGAFARNAYLRKLAPHDEEIDVTLTLHPASADHSSCTPTNADTTRYRSAERLSDGNTDWRIVPSSDEVFILKVTNNGSSEPYFTILDLMPNGDVGQLFPPARYSAAEARLAPGQEYTIPFCFAVDPIPGLEVIKLFAAREPVDFGPLTTLAGRRTRAARGPLHDLERLFTESYERTRSDAVGARPGMASTSSVQIEVVVP